jgi:hypothetical protein
MDLALPIVFAVPFAISAAIRRPFVVVVAAAFFPLVAAGTVAGMWGTDVGDGLLEGTVLVTITATGGAFGGLVSGRAFASRGTQH